MDDQTPRQTTEPHLAGELGPGTTWTVVRTAGRTARWFLLGGAILGAVVGLVVGLRLAGADYTSSAQVLLGPADAVDKSSSTYDNIQYVNQRMSTYAQIATSDRVTGPAARQLGGDPAELAGRITATAGDGTTVLSVAVRDRNPQDAARAATAVTRALVGEISAVETPAGATTARVTARVVVEPVAAPPTPAAAAPGVPRRWRPGRARPHDARRARRRLRPPPFHRTRDPALGPERPRTAAARPAGRLRPTGDRLADRTPAGTSRPPSAVPPPSRGAPPLARTAPGMGYGGP